jgi:PST family polysaccharide transporter
VLRLAGRGGVYLGLRYGLGALISLGNMFVLTWWIGPHAYGVFVTAIGLSAFLASLARAGFDTYLVRRPEELDASHYHTASSLIAGFSLALTAAGLAAAPLLIRWYGNREFLLPYLALLSTIPLVGLAGPPTAKLERGLNFRAVAQIELGGQALALLVGLTLAWRGLGVWAPVMGHLAWQSFAMAAAFGAARMVPRIRFDSAYAREMLSFGAGYTASQRVWQMRNLVNPVIVARLAGAEGAAFVALAIRVAEGLGFIRIAAGRLAVAALGRIQHDRAKFATTLEKALRLQVMLLGPLLCCFALVGPKLVTRLMGAKWVPSLEVYPLVAAAVLLNSLFNLQASALFVVGQQWAVLRSYAANVVLLAGATLILSPGFGIKAYGWGDLAACCGYLLLNSKLKQHVRIEQKPLAVWVVAFLLPLALMHAPWWLALGTPLLWLAIAQAAGFGAVPDETGRKSGLDVRHLATFLAKARQRKAAYVAAVVRYQANHQIYRWRLAWRRVCATRAASQASAPAPAAGIPDLQFFFDARDIERIAGAVPGHLKRQVVAEACRVLAHRFHFRGQEVEFGDRIHWNECPDGNRSWQWDLNRHRYFITLGTAYYYSGRPVFLRELEDLWRDWIACNPPGIGAAWRHPFEVASRLQNWVWAHFLLERSGLAAGPCLQQLRDAMQEHGRYLYRHLEYHWPNNHLLLEAKVLFELALLFPQWPESGRWRARASSLLEDEVLEQILPDGVHSELCSMYHRIVAGELGALALLCRRLGSPLAPRVEARIERAMEFSRALVRADGSMPLTGDSAEDDANLRFGFIEGSRFDLDWWTGQNGRRAWGTQRRDCGPQLHMFPHGGYAVASGGPQRLHLLFDTGDFSACRSPNHGHCDALSFELYAGGRPLIVDPGAYLPWNDATWARQFRATGAHNTLVIDGREQSQLSEHCDVVGRNKTRLLDHWCDHNGVGIGAECVPYWAGRNGTAHKREIRWDGAGRVLVADSVSGSGRHRLDWYFHFAPGLEAAQEANRVTLRDPATGARVFELQSDGPVVPELTLARGMLNPRMGWVSRNSAEVLPAYVVRYTAEIELPAAITFRLDFGQEQSQEAASGA